MFNLTSDENVSVSDVHIGLDTSHDLEYVEEDFTNSTFEDLNNYTTKDYCMDHLKIIRPYDPYTAIVCALYFIFGVVCAFFGYRCFKAIMFLYGFIFGSIVVYLICAEEEVLPEWSNALIAMSAGLLFGLITMLVQYVGLFMLGFHTGLLVGLVGLCGVELHYTPPSAWITLGVLLAAGLTLALLNLYFQKWLTIFGSAIYGGAILMVTTDYFLEDSLVLGWVWERVKVDRMVEEGLGAMETLPRCWMAWAVSAVWPLVFLTGLIVQACCTGRGIHHEQSLSLVKYSKQDLNETKEERKQRKYRYLYQVRMCHGDVISQVNRPISGKYVQHLDESAFH